MTDFREAQNEAHPNKTNTLMVGIILLLVGILSVQIWLLYSALNHALEGQLNIATASFIGSSVLFLCALWLLRYLPQSRGFVKRNRSESKYK